MNEPPKQIEYDAWPFTYHNFHQVIKTSYLKRLTVSGVSKVHIVEVASEETRTIGVHTPINKEESLCGRNVKIS